MHTRKPHDFLKASLIVLRCVWLTATITSCATSRSACCLALAHLVDYAYPPNYDQIALLGARGSLCLNKMLEW